MTSRMRAGGFFARCLAALVGSAVLASAAGADETLTYSYDALGRLVKVARAGTVNNNANECYTYDPASNRSSVTVSIAADCNTPSFSINDRSATEGGIANFTVTRAGPTSGTYTVNYATADNTATAGSDYTAKSGTLTFVDGVSTQTVSVTTLQDSIAESNETFYVNLSAPSGGATISDAQGVGTIIDDDSPLTCSGVTFTIGNANSAVTEGQPLTFTVTKSGTATGSCSVDYATQDGTATAGSDYTATSGTLAFSATQTSQNVLVPTIDDRLVENTESLFLGLSNATSGATIASPPLGEGLILDNDTGNHPPIANPDSLAVTACGSGQVNVLANDSDPDGDPITLTAIVSSTKGTSTFTSDGWVTYTASTSSGTGVVTYTVTDSHNASTNGTLNVTISGGQCMAPVQAPGE